MPAEGDPSYGSPANRGSALESGVFYACQRCGNCCKWPGDVRIEDEEIPVIAAHLGLSWARRQDLEYAGPATGNLIQCGGDDSVSILSHRCSMRIP